VQYVCSPYGPLPQVLCPTALGDPSTSRHDASQVDLSFLFKSDFKSLNLSHSFLLQSSQMGQAPVMPWGGSPAAWQPPTWPPQPPARFWPPRCLTFLVSGTSHLQVRVLALPPPPPMSWAPTPGGQAPPWGMPPWMAPQRPPSSLAMVRLS
jgi:hypothetical protein